MRKSLAITVLCAALIAPALSAQSAIKPDTVAEPRDAAKMALVRELMTVANFRQQLLTTMAETSRLQSSMLPVPQAFWDKLLERAAQDADTLLAPMALDYARYFSTADLRALIVFYKSPVGQRVSLVSPTINANSSFTGSQWGQRVGQEIAGEMMGGGAGAPPAGAKPTAPKKP